jgi:hypothetical protein
VEEGEVVFQPGESISAKRNLKLNNTAMPVDTIEEWFKKQNSKKNETYEKYLGEGFQPTYE